MISDKKNSTQASNSNPWIRNLSFVLIAVILLMLAFYRFWFLRQPDRVVPQDSLAFVSPANGLIAAVVEWDSTLLEWEKDGAAVRVWTNDIGPKGYLIAIEMNVMNVHYQRAPMDGSFVVKDYTEGKFKNALVKANNFGLRMENERSSLLFETESGMRYKVVQVAGFLARRIVDYMEPGQKVKQGDVIGLIKLGSQVGLILPEGVEPMVKPGDIVTDGETILARIK